MFWFLKERLRPPVPSHTIQRIFFPAEEKLILNKKYGIYMKSFLSLLVVDHREPLRPARFAYVVGVESA